MADEHHPMSPVGPMRDDAIDRAVREALDVAPSPDFVARVRARIASEPAPRGVFGGWMAWTPIGACAVAAAVAFAMWIGRPAPQVPQPVTDRQTAVATPAPVAPTPSAVRLPPSPLRGYGETRKPEPAEAPVVPVGAGFSRPVVASRKEPEILISAEESAALRRLISRASEGQIVVEFSEAASVPDGEVPPLPEIKPLKIDPIVPVNGEEGVRQ